MVLPCTHASRTSAAPRSQQDIGGICTAPGTAPRCMGCPTPPGLPSPQPPTTIWRPQATAEPQCPSPSTPPTPELALQPTAPRSPLPGWVCLTSPAPQPDASPSPAPAQPQAAPQPAAAAAAAAATACGGDGSGCAAQPEHPGSRRERLPHGQGQPESPSLASSPKAQHHGPTALVGRSQDTAVGPDVDPPGLQALQGEAAPPGGAGRPGEAAPPGRQGQLPHGQGRPGPSARDSPSPAPPEVQHQGPTALAGGPQGPLGTADGPGPDPLGLWAAPGLAMSPQEAVPPGGAERPGEAVHGPPTVPSSGGRAGHARQPQGAAGDPGPRWQRERGEGGRFKKGRRSRGKRERAWEGQHQPAGLAAQAGAGGPAVPAAPLHGPAAAAARGGAAAHAGAVELAAAGRGAGGVGEVPWGSRAPQPPAQARSQAHRALCCIAPCTNACSHPPSCSSPTGGPCPAVVVPDSDGGDSDACVDLLGSSSDDLDGHEGDGAWRAAMQAGRGGGGGDGGSLRAGSSQGGGEGPGHAGCGGEAGGGDAGPGPSSVALRAKVSAEVRQLLGPGRAPSMELGDGVGHAPARLTRGRARRLQEELGGGPGVGSCTANGPSGSGQPGPGGSAAAGAAAGNGRGTRAGVVGGRARVLGSHMLEETTDCFWVGCKTSFHIYFLFSRWKSSCFIFVV
jgi:hypothetical protein